MEDAVKNVGGIAFGAAVETASHATLQAVLIFNALTSLRRHFILLF